MKSFSNAIYAMVIVICLVNNCIAGNTNSNKQSKPKEVIKEIVKEVIVEKPVYINNPIREGCLMGNCKDEFSLYKKDDFVFLGKLNDSSQMRLYIYPTNGRILINNPENNNALIDLNNGKIQLIDFTTYHNNDNIKDTTFKFNKFNLTIFQKIGAFIDIFLSKHGLVILLLLGAFLAIAITILLFSFILPYQDKIELQKNWFEGYLFVLGIIICICFVFRWIVVIYIKFENFLENHWDYIQKISKGETILFQKRSQSQSQSTSSSNTHNSQNSRNPFTNPNTTDGRLPPEFR